MSAASKLTLLKIKKSLVEDFLKFLGKKLNVTGVFNIKVMGLSAMKQTHRKGRQKPTRLCSKQERGPQMRALCCARAVRYYVPSVLIFKREIVEDKIRHGAPS